eukprot:1178984-Prorocentrum_minimum.AAC.3
MPSRSSTLALDLTMRRPSPSCDCTAATASGGGRRLCTSRIISCRRGSGGGQEGKYRSSVDVRDPQNPKKSEEYQRHPQGVRRGSGGGSGGDLSIQV